MNVKDVKDPLAYKTMKSSSILYKDSRKNLLNIKDKLENSMTAINEKNKNQIYDKTNITIFCLNENHLLI